ncbi:spore germination protein GerPE [Paenibacillus allorhizosphaerae]|uniref:Spore germination protein GerPE n=1 Tax=Paenibacillus allorhizosphaerae TaxID=2849866 RepID=A0ABN7TGZ0_9BACL|nr:spore germination protein GerPE [Paenibacillus allorhizosphaerae]CAG7621776.1 putative spore germination protein GerPE [Paenibacillus allorhizosphaerae]
MRVSVVDVTKVNAVISASSVFIGDMKQFQPKANILAVQREIPIYNGNEGDLSPYLVFRSPITIPSEENTVPAAITNENGYIRVGAIRVLSVSTSSLYQIGSTDYIHAESRLKHIRQLLTGTSPLQ